MVGSICFGGDSGYGAVPYSARPRRFTNADRIRAMTNAELASFIAVMSECDCCVHSQPCDFDCEEGIARWLDRVF